MKKIHSLLTSKEVCARLGITRDSLYAYVSRGFVRARVHPADARRSLYDGRDIETLLARKQRGRSRQAVAASTINWGEPILRSKITRIEDGSYFYRGADAVDLSKVLTFETVLDRLALVDMTKIRPSSAQMIVDKNRLPVERLMTCLVSEMHGRRKRDGRVTAAKIVRKSAVVLTGLERDTDQPIHQMIADQWSSCPEAADTIRQALVLCADHELNASTYAARVAASAGASLPASLIAGLATLSGTAHGGITTRCLEWMTEIENTHKKDRRLLCGDGTPPPGFGHPLYPKGDPRAQALLDLCTVAPKWRSIIKQVRTETGQHPNLDFGLAFVQRDLGLPEGAGLGLFALGRMAGWLAHIFEQRETGTLIRPRALTS